MRAIRLMQGRDVGERKDWDMTFHEEKADARDKA